MRSDRFEVFRLSAFFGANSYAAKGLCSICSGTEPAEWMKGYKAYCIKCKARYESKESDHLRLSRRQLQILKYMADGGELHEDLEYEGEAYLENVFDRNVGRLPVEKFAERRRLERKGVIRHTRNLDTTHFIYEITDKGRRAIERRS